MLLSRHLALLAGSLAMIGCRQDMHNQPRYKPLAGTDFFGDGRSARPVIDGTVARGPSNWGESRRPPFEALSIEPKEHGK